MDVFATVLALYMHDKDQLLPSREEVLICSPETSTEEVTFDETPCVLSFSFFAYQDETWMAFFFHFIMTTDGGFVGVIAVFG